MQGSIFRGTFFAVFSFLGLFAEAQESQSASEVIISVADQRLMVVRDGMWTQKYRVSTSKFGIGDSYGSYKTPLGKLRVCDKIGAGFASGSVIKHRSATGEVLPVNAPGRDPIVTRILWLEGLEAANEHAKARGIYIHGTVEESKIGEAVSYGCIRMKSRDVIDVFNLVPVGTTVTIQAERLPKLRRWSAPEASIIAASKPAAEPQKPVAEKTPPKEPARNQRLAEASNDRFISGNGHTVLTRREAEQLHRNHSVPRLSNGTTTSDALKESILFADLPQAESKPKAGAKH